MELIPNKALTRTREILNVFQKLTGACFSHIELESILLPILPTCQLARTNLNKYKKNKKYV